MTAEERSAKWIAELEEVERMTPTQLRDALAEIAKQQNFAGAVASVVLAKVSNEPRGCPTPGACSCLMN